MRSVYQILGPGLLMAGAAIGVSHLVQSTRAGAAFGLQLLILVILANFLKYPFFEFGHRYATATGKNLLHGYHQLGRGFVWAFFLLNLITSVGTMAGVTFVTGALAHHLFAETLTVGLWSVLILLLSGTLLLVGHYKLLDRLIKPLMLVLLLSTFLAFMVALLKRTDWTPLFEVQASPFTWATVPFLLALMGWMPAPIETSVWQSIWIEEKNRHLGFRVNWRLARLDFNIGYLATALLAVLFLLLGAVVMHGRGFEFSDSGALFAAQVVSLYTENLGSWSWPLIAFAALATMFSTTLTCLDAYSRSLAAAGETLWSVSVPTKKRLYRWGLLWAGGWAAVVIYFFVTNLRSLVDLVTVAAFLTAPAFAYMNYRLIFSDQLPQEFRPTRWQKGLCRLGLAYLILFSLIYLAYLWL